MNSGVRFAVMRNEALWSDLKHSVVLPNVGYSGTGSIHGVLVGTHHHSAPKRMLGRVWNIEYYIPNR